MLNGFKATPPLDAKASKVFLEKINSNVKTFPVPTPKAQDFINKLLLKLRGDTK